MNLLTDERRLPGPAVRPARVRRPRARFDGQVRVMCAVLLGLSLAVVTLWWIQDNGLSDLTGWETGLTSVGRITGLVASVLLLVQVLLMARIPAVERAFGQDRLTSLHRTIGFSSFNLMLVHIVTITWGYAGGRLPSFPGTLWNLTLTYPGMLLAAAGSVALLLVVVTSIRAARRRLRYESWHLMHLYAYLGVGLALPHQLWTGQQFTSSPTRTVAWWTAWAITAGAVLIWRVGQPFAVNTRHRLRIDRVVPEGQDIWSVHISGRELNRLEVEAGQFFAFRFLNGPGWSRANPYSLSAAPDGTRLRITVQGVGDGSNAVAHLKPGTRVLVEGPYGRLSDRPRTRRRVAFLGAGVGVTPLRALAEGLDYERGDAAYVERFSDEPLFAAESDLLAVERGLQLIRVRGRRRAPDSWLGPEVGSADDLTTLTGWIPDIAARDVYVCGPAPWTELVLRTLTLAGLPESQLHLETFAW